MIRQHAVTVTHCDYCGRTWLHPHGGRRADLEAMRHWQQCDAKPNPQLGQRRWT